MIYGLKISLSYNLRMPIDCVCLYEQLKHLKSLFVLFVSTIRIEDCLHSGQIRSVLAGAFFNSSISFSQALSLLSTLYNAFKIDHKFLIQPIITNSQFFVKEIIT